MLAVVLGAAALAAAPPSPPAIFPSEIELITVDAVVVDKKGRPVPNLTREDFILSEGGERREIATFEAFSPRTPAEAGTVEPPPSPVTSNDSLTVMPGRTFAIVVDDLSLSRLESKPVIAALSEFVRTALEEGDRVTITTTGGDVSWTARLPEGRADLLAAVDRIKARRTALEIAADSMSDYEAYAIHNDESPNGGGTTTRVIERWIGSGYCPQFGDHPAGEAGRGNVCQIMVENHARDQDAGRRDRTRAALTAIRRAAASLAPVPGRKALLLYSRGFLHDRALPVRDVEEAAREANAAVYFFNTRALVPQGSVPGMAGGWSNTLAWSSLESAGSRDLADNTGGFTERNTDAFGKSAARVANESRVFYMLGFYAPPGRKPGDWRKIKVEVARRGLTVRARRGYLVGGPSRGHK